ncbi:MAG: UbiA-like polyprenyltransferase [Bacteroidia bacterium]|nr:UbiA-like polyprenyltransferase [Bacteroidia bacterium]
MTKQTNKTVSNYLSLIKFSHTIFALPFAIIGYFLAIHFTEKTFDLKLFLLIILCMVFARSAAMAFNRYIDRKIDEQNIRTAVREIPAGAVKPQSALLFVIVNCLLFISTTYFINSICFFLSPVALAVVLGYSLTKRFTALCHVVLGIGLSLAPIGAYLAVTGVFDWLPLFFSFAVLFWVSGFDIIYALQDEEFDKSKNLKSIPVWLGKKGALMLSNVFHIVSASFIIYAGFYAHFNSWYWVGTLVFVGLLIYQHTLVKPNDLSKVNIAFFTTNGIASVVFAVFVLVELFLS